MKCPNFNEEKKLWKKGYRIVAGIDEAGRGALAGPVVAAAVVVRQFFAKKNFRGKTFLKKYSLLEIKDSKKLTPKKREEFFKILTENPEIEWGTGRVSEKVIDQINILEAAKLAMKKAIDNLKSKIPRNKGNLLCDKRNPKLFLIIDGNFKLDLPIAQKSIIKADEKVFSCIAAGIIAKVARDKMMLRYDKKYPEYGFASHKGYGTKFHRKMIKKYGPCKIHRKSFSPIKNL
jgi:ribonuclease HII